MTDRTASPSAAASRRLGPRIALAAGVVLVALGLVELGLRLWAPVRFRAPERGRESAWTERVHRASDVPGLAYELEPGRSLKHARRTITINSLGMRDLEPRRDPDGELRRVVVVGDSVSFGLGVEDDEVWPRLLEQRLDEGGGPPVDVLNLSVSGYSSRDEARLLEHRAPELRPDLVILAYFLNDPETEPVDNLGAYFAEPAWWQHSHLLRKLASVRNQRERARYGNDYFRFLHEGPKWASVPRAFGAVAACAEREGFRVLVAIFPSLKRKRWGPYPYRDLHERVAAAARERGFEVLDLLPAFEGSGHGPLEVRADVWHPNALGHRIAADAIHDALVARPDLLEGRRGPARVPPQRESE